MSALTLFTFFLVVGLEILQSYFIFSSWFCFRMRQSLDDGRGPGDDGKGQPAAPATAAEIPRDCKYYCRHCARGVLILLWGAFVLASLGLRAAEYAVIEALAVVGFIICAPLALSIDFGKTAWNQIRSVAHRTRLILGHRCHFTIISY